MKPLRIPLKAVLYKEKDNWIAHCLEFDVIGDGKSHEEALQNLNEAIVIQINTSIKYKNPSNLFKPADGSYFRMFAEGRNIATGILHLFPKVDHVTIEQVEAREYNDDCDDDSIDSNVNLVTA